MRRWIWSAPLLLAVMAHGAPAAPKKAPNYSFDFPTGRFGTNAGDQLGTSVTCCDLDRDGNPETLVGARDTDPNGVQDAGSVFVYSGRDGHLLHRFDGTVPFGVFGISVQCSDINRDGRPDVLIGAANQGRVFVYSGRDWSLLHQLEPAAGTLQSGFSLACADVNRDRHPDIITGAPNIGRAGTGAGSVVVYSGKDGSILRRFDGTDSGDLFGHSVASGDVNHDGYADVLAGAPHSDVEGHVDAGRLTVYSGKTGAILRSYVGLAAGDNLGISTVSCDLNRDHYADIVVGGHAIDAGGILDAGSVFVYSGRDGAVLRRLNGSAVADHVGYSLTCGLVDGDKVPDIVSGSIQEENPPANSFESVWFYSGKSGALLQRIKLPAMGDLFGLTLALCENRSGRVTSLQVGAPFADPNDQAKAGTLWQYSVVKTR